MFFYRKTMSNHDYVSTKYCNGYFICNCDSLYICVRRIPRGKLCDDIHQNSTQQILTDIRNLMITKVAPF